MNAAQILKGVNHEYLSSLIAQYKQPLNAAEKRQFDVWATQYGISVETPVYGDYARFKAYLDHVEKCRKCSATDNTCSGKRLLVEDSRLKVFSCECPRRAARRIINSAQVPSKFRNAQIADFNFDKYSDEDAVNVAGAINQNTSLYIYGKPGTGKTFLSSIIINERAYKMKASHFYTVTDLVADLKDFENPDRRAEKLHKLMTCACLVIDDIGAEYASKWVASNLFSILDSRYKDNRQVILNSNFNLDTLCSRYPDYYGERISRRLRAMCAVFKAV